MRMLLPSLLEKKQYRFTLSHLIAASVLSVILPAALATQAHAQGFGFNKTKSTLTYKWPARVYLPNATFAVRVSSQAELALPAVEQMREFLEIGVRRINPGLKPVSDAPETVINCTIIDAETSSIWEYRTTSEYKVTGTHTVTNPETGATETVTDYGYVIRRVPNSGSHRSDERRIQDQSRDEAGLLLDHDKLTPAYSVWTFHVKIWQRTGIDSIISNMAQQAV